MSGKTILRQGQWRASAREIRAWCGDASATQLSIGSIGGYVHAPSAVGCGHTEMPIQYELSLTTRRPINLPQRSGSLWSRVLSGVYEQKAPAGGRGSRAGAGTRAHFKINEQHSAVPRGLRGHTCREATHQPRGVCWACHSCGVVTRDARAGGTGRLRGRAHRQSSAMPPMRWARPSKFQG